VVRVRGPSLAQEAAGGLGQTLIFSQSKGRSYVKRWAAPANPNTTPQLAMRRMHQWLSQHWSTLVAADQDTWAELAAQTNIPPYNAFISHNLARWRSFLAPCDRYPATATGSYGSFYLWYATACSRGMDLSVSVGPPADSRAVLLMRSQTPGFTPKWSNLCYSVPWLDAGYKCWFDRPIPAGTYYYRLMFTTRFGLMNGWTSQKTVIVAPY